MMPLCLWLLRHGESEANIANHNLKHGVGDLHNPKEMIGTPQFLCHLSERGCQQAASAGDWFRSNGLTPDVGIFSSFIRTVDTALETGLPLDWLPENRIVEQDWDCLENILTQAEYNSRQHEIEACLSGHWLNRPGAGESKLDLFYRGVMINDSLARNYSKKRVLQVSHGQLMEVQGATYFHWALTDLEGPMRDWPQLFNPVNCQIIEFTRVDPQGVLPIQDSFQWVRSVVPWDLTHEKNMNWRQIKRKKYDLVALRELSERYPHYFPSPA